MASTPEPYQPIPELQPLVPTQALGAPRARKDEVILPMPAEWHQDCKSSVAGLFLYFVALLCLCVAGYLVMPEQAQSSLYSVATHTTSVSPVVGSRSHSRNSNPRSMPSLMPKGSAGSVPIPVARANSQGRGDAHYVLKSSPDSHTTSMVSDHINPPSSTHKSAVPNMVAIVTLVSGILASAMAFALRRRSDTNIPTHAMMAISNPATSKSEAPRVKSRKVTFEGSHEYGVSETKMAKVLDTVTVDLGDRSYPINIGTNLIADPSLLIPHIHGNSVFIVTNTTIQANGWLNQVSLRLSADYNVAVATIPDGEEYKTVEIWEQILDAALERGMDRNTTFIAIGGGVVGDITGFAAASYQRGVRFIQIPTTVMAMVDSSVGGKTAVNTKRGKNMIGAFHQPDTVVIDINTLRTLEDREFRSGISEVYKYGLIRDPEFFEWCEANMSKIIDRDPEALSYMIKRSCEHKAEVVAEDEREAGGRALLNLGHTFGHAIEAHAGYGKWLHGEAVATGICMAADLSHRLGWLSQEDLDRIVTITKAAGLPVHPPNGMTVEDFREYMVRDKKVLNGTLRLILLKGIGNAVFTADYAVMPKAGGFTSTNPQAGPSEAVPAADGDHWHDSAARIKACKDDWERACTILREAAAGSGSEGKANEYLSCAAIAVCGRAGQWKKALELFNEVKAPNPPAWRAVLGALGPSQAEALLSRMRSSGAPYDDRALRIVLASYRADAGPALRVLRFGQDWIREDMGCRPGVCPSIHTYVATARACTHGRDFSKARALVVEARVALVRRESWRQEQEDEEEELETLKELEIAIWRQWMAARLSLQLATVAKVCGQEGCHVDWDNDAAEEAQARLPAVDEAATSSLEVALGKAADEGVMPSFVDPGARSGYLLRKLTSRSARIAEFLLEADRLTSKTVKEAGNGRAGDTTGTWMSGAIGELLGGPSVQVLSIGGGPGFDLASVALLADFGWLGQHQGGDERRGCDDDNSSRGSSKGKEKGCRVEALVLDFEEGWEDCVGALEEAVCSTSSSYAPKGSTPIPQHRAGFGQCDITVPLHAPINAKALRFLKREGSSSRAENSKLPPVLVVASYVVAENAIALRSGGFAFVEGLLEVSPAGTGFLFAETTHRLWPDILAAAYRGLDRSDSRPEYSSGGGSCFSATPGSHHRLEVVFPTISGRRGVALFLRKVVSAGTAAMDSSASSVVPDCVSRPQEGNMPGTEPSPHVCVESLIARIRNDSPDSCGLGTNSNAELLRRFVMDDQKHSLRLAKLHLGPGEAGDGRREEEVAARRLERQRIRVARRRQLAKGTAPSVTVC